MLGHSKQESSFLSMCSENLVQEGGLLSLFIIVTILDFRFLSASQSTFFCSSCHTQQQLLETCKTESFAKILPCSSTGDKYDSSHNYENNDHSIQKLRHDAGGGWETTLSFGVILYVSKSGRQLSYYHAYTMHMHIIL